MISIHTHESTHYFRAPRSRQQEDAPDKPDPSVPEKVCSVARQDSIQTSRERKGMHDRERLAIRAVMYLGGLEEEQVHHIRSSPILRVPGRSGFIAWHRGVARLSGPRSVSRPVRLRNRVLKNANDVESPSGQRG